MLCDAFIVKIMLSNDMISYDMVSKSFDCILLYDNLKSFHLTLFAKTRFPFRDIH